jgi:hypothetical protein
MNPVDEISQVERRRVFENDRIAALERRLSTYHAVAQGSIDDERQGRFAAVGKVTVTGTGPTLQYPRQPETSPANQAVLTGQEGPLGYSVNDQEPVGEKFELGDKPSTSQASDVEGNSSPEGNAKGSRLASATLIGAIAESW